MSIKPGSQTKLLQITCEIPKTNDVDTFYSIYSEPTHMVYISYHHEKIDKPKKIVNSNNSVNHFRIDEIYQVKNKENAFM